MTNSHILVNEFDYVEPASLEEAIALLDQYGRRAQVLAGGTYLLVQMKMERLAPEYIINVGKVPGLDGIIPQDDGLRIGALSSIRALRNSPQVWAHYTALAEACAAFGSTQIQLMGTLGGNVCNGSPASDSVPALLAFDARLVLVGPSGERIVPVEEFLLGPGRTALREGELLVAVQLPGRVGESAILTQRRKGAETQGKLEGSILTQRRKGAETQRKLEGGSADPRSPIRNRQSAVGSAFIKLSRVAADLAKASVAAALVREGERIVHCRLAFGSLGPTVSRARAAEEVLAGQPFSAELALEAGRVAAGEISPIDDVRSTAWYRREVVKALTHDVLQVAWQRAEDAAGKNPKSKIQNPNSQRWEAREQEGRNRGTRNTEHGTRNTLHVPHNTTYPITLTVNGTRHTLPVAPNELLLNVLRERLQLTGTKYGCGIGECGACTIHLDGLPALSCLVLAIAADGSDVLTVEGLAGPDGKLDPLQEAFIAQNAFQCGYCTPGMLMMTRGLLAEIPSPTEDDVRDYLKGNRCRCTGFAGIVRAVMQGDSAGEYTRIRSE